MLEIEVCVIQRVRLGGACGPPPPFVAPLVPRCALTSGATPRVRASRRLSSQLASTRRARQASTWGCGDVCNGRSPLHAGGGGGKERGLPRSAARRAEWAASLRAEQRLAPGGHGLPRSAARRAEWAAL